MDDLKETYEEAWKDDSYRERCIGLDLLPEFLITCKPSKSDTIIDAGCGSGKATQWLHDNGYDVQGIDIAENSPDPGSTFLFDQEDMRERSSGKYDWVYCTEVLEHLHEQDVDKALLWIQNTMIKGAFLSIPTFMDDQEKYHLTVRGWPFWHDKFIGRFYPAWHVTVTPGSRIIVRIQRRD